MYRTKQKSFGLDHSFGFQIQIFVQNLKEIVLLLDVFEIRTILQPNDFGLSEIRTRLDFGITLYFNLRPF